jgi:hypothetical protein
MTGIVAGTRDCVIPAVEMHTEKDSEGQIEDRKHSHQHKSREDLARVYCRCRSKNSAIGDTHQAADFREPLLTCLREG